MRHRKSGRQLGRNTHHRRALFRSLVTALLEHERIETTEAKAKELRILAERMISLGKEGSLHAQRRAAAYIRAKRVVSKLFKDLAGPGAPSPGKKTQKNKTKDNPPPHTPAPPPPSKTKKKKKHTIHTPQHNTH